MLRRSNTLPRRWPFTGVFATCLAFILLVVRLLDYPFEGVLRLPPSSYLDLVGKIASTAGRQLIGRRWDEPGAFTRLDDRGVATLTIDNAAKLNTLNTRGDDRVGRVLSRALRR